MPQIYAAFTGDLRGSRHDAKALEATMQTLEALCGKWGAAHDIDLRFTRHRGDGWQIIVPARYFLEVTLTITAGLRANPDTLSTRISIGLGEVSFVGTTDLSDAAGSALIAAGDQIDAFTTNSGTLAVSGPFLTPMLEGVIRMIDWMTQGWTAPQAEAVSLYLLNPQLGTNKERAAALGISRQAFEARFNSSGFPALAPIRSAILTTPFEAIA